MGNRSGVRGAGGNIVFFTHNHEEDDGQESFSKVNAFEVRRCHILIHPSRYQPSQVNLVVDLVMQRLRTALRSLKVAVAVDERDEDQLVRQGFQDEDETPSVEEVAVAKHVRLVRGTIIA